MMKLAFAALAALPALAFAAGGHDAIGCGGCHALKPTKAGSRFVVEPNTKYLNPRTGQPFAGTTAICLACHQDVDKGGKGYAPVSRHNSHPFGLDSVNPKIAKVPPALLREGRFECMSCHDPHPSNPNFKYLRVNVGKTGDDVDVFCVMCHSVKADATQEAALFDSMDERRGAVGGAATAAPKGTPATK